MKHIFPPGAFWAFTLPALAFYVVGNSLAVERHWPWLSGLVFVVVFQLGMSYGEWYVESKRRA